MYAVENAYYSPMSLFDKFTYHLLVLLWHIYSAGHVTLKK